MPARSWNITERLINDAIRQRRWLVNVENGVVREIASVMRSAERDMTARMVEYLSSNDPDTWLTGARQARVVNGYQKGLSDLFPRLERTLEKSLREVAGAEADLLHGRLTRALAQLPEEIPIYRPSPEFVREITTNFLPANPDAGVKPVIDRLAGLEDVALRRVKSALQSGIAAGDSTASIARAIREAIGAESVTAHEATVIARTQIQRVSNDVARQFYRQNARLVPRVQFVAALDRRTCLICGGLDGKVYDTADAPYIPLHPQCRCFLSPVVASWEELGIKPEDANPDLRRLFDGKAAPRTTYEAWLTQQPAGLQRSILGPSRYESFRSGMGVETFAKDRRVLTIEQYKRRAA